MKVLQINSVCGIGSTGRIATDIHNKLIEQGHESYIAYGRDLPKNCNNAIRIGSKTDNYSHVAKTRIFDMHGFGSKKATIEFIEKVKELDPDLIHLHNIHGYYINIEILFNYLKEANKPVIWTLHDCWSFTGHCAYFDYVGCDKWKNECHSCPERKSYPVSLVLDNSQDNYLRKKEIFNGVKNLTIVAPSRWLAGLVKESFLKQYPVEVINNGIDLSVFKPTKNNFRDKYNIKDKYVILGVASIWDRRKGLKYFHELAENLHDDEIIVLVGLSEKQLKHLPDRIIGITRTNNVNELVDIYSSADVFVNPTLEDNFPTTNLEALACGTPVITFNTGGSIESVFDKCGCISKEKSVKSLIESMAKIRSGNFDKKKCIYHSTLYNKSIKFDEYLRCYLGKYGKENGYGS